MHPIADIAGLSPSEFGEASGTCAVCGASGTDHFDRAEILSSSTGSVSVLLRYAGDTFCPHCAEMWRERRKWNRSLFVCAGKVQFPLIANNPKSDRPTWSDLIHTGAPVADHVAIITTDPKKRLWPLVQSGHGDHMSLFVHAPGYGISQSFDISWRALDECLRLIEDIYSAGYVKQAIQNGLYRGAKDIAQAIEYEKQLSQWRGRDEFYIALLIAQKRKD